MNNTGNISIKMGITQNRAGWQGIVGQWLNHVLRDAQARAQIRRLLEQHELPVIQLQVSSKTDRINRTPPA